MMIPIMGPSQELVQSGTLTELIHPKEADYPSQRGRLFPRLFKCSCMGMIHSAGDIYWEEIMKLSQSLADSITI